MLNDQNLTLEERDKIFFYINSNIYQIPKEGLEDIENYLLNKFKMLPEKNDVYERYNINQVDDFISNIVSSLKFKGNIFYFLITKLHSYISILYSLFKILAFVCLIGSYFLMSSNFLNTKIKIILLASFVGILFFFLLLNYLNDNYSKITILFIGDGDIIRLIENDVYYFQEKSYLALSDAGRLFKDETIVKSKALEVCYYRLEKYDKKKIYSFKENVLFFLMMNYICFNNDYKYTMLKDYELIEESLKLLERVYSFNNNSLFILENLGLYNLKNGNNNEALYYYKKAFELCNIMYFNIYIKYIEYLNKCN
ncbi:MAG: hypothetical protein A2086_05005 [Spirochaetes bacterium GWD1_27_9]|nr:MAG: hypothetical protein A2Z98_06370 [Spirochaetes bacterium GWB1_27_13]OHD25769.1 MAG: hypothetical protein A2Y34_03795 [Spirochaetes bacterium GWC1_27_15]OHD30090.1 MAG: hypothetical protein A2086_05005 [Spirochaetes bacterium GWD1_27_9]